MPSSWPTLSGEEVTQLITKGSSPKWQGYEYQSNGLLFVTSENVRDGFLDIREPKYLPLDFSKRARNSVLKSGDILINIVGASIGRTCIFDLEDIEANVNQAVCVFRLKSGFDPRFFLYYFQSPAVQRALLGQTSDSARPNLSLTDFREFRFPVPSLSEQRKIAAILGTWDQAIDAIARRKQALDRQFEGMRLRLFEIAYATHNQTTQAKQLFEPVSEKGRSDLPLLAVMQDIGVVRRDELDRRVMMPDGDIHGYKVVREGDFVISLRSFEGGLEFSRVTGLVSPAYTVLRANGGDYVPDYYRHFFKSRSFVGRLDRLIFGIRDGKQIAFRDFGDMKIPNPALNEQAKAADILGLMEREMLLAEKGMNALHQQKRGLMQKLLTGEWRVPTDAEVAA